MISRTVSRKWALLLRMDSESPKSLISTTGPRAVENLRSRMNELVWSPWLTPQLLHLGRAVDVINMPVRTLQHQVAAPGSFLLTVHQDPAFDGCEIANIKRRHRKSVIGQQDSVYR